MIDDKTLDLEDTETILGADTKDVPPNIKTILGMAGILLGGLESHISNAEVRGEIARRRDNE